MKYNQQTQEDILRGKEQGLSGREIARQLGLSKSGVNDFIADVSRVGFKKPRILIFDLESSPSIVAAFQRWKVNIGTESVIQEGGFLLSACWKFLGEELQYSVLTPDEAVACDDSRLVAELYEAFENADIVVAHNAVRFDVPLFKSRLIVNNMPPTKTVKVIDTLQIAKTLKFNSNKLDSLGHYLGVGRKIETSGMGLWLRCMQGEKESLDIMLEYNKQDVHLLEEIYLKLRAFDTKPANLGHYYDDDVSRCPACGSSHVEPTGNNIYTPVSSFDEMLCNDCGHRSRKRQALNSKAKRATMLLTPKASG
jgi:hypothetical protein